MGVVRLGTRSAATTGGTARITASSVSERQLVLAEIESRDLVADEFERPQPMSERDLHIALAEKAQRRLDEGGPKSIAGDERPAGLAARRQRLAHDGAGERGAAFLRLGVERRDPERPRQPLVQRTRAITTSQIVFSSDARSRRAKER